MKIVPATAEIMKRYYGMKPLRTTRAWAAVDGDDVLGVGGMCVNTSRLLVFLGMTPETRERFRKYPRVLVRCVRQLQDMARQKGLVLQAEADKTVPCAEKFLERMGFEKLKGTEIYLWPSNSSP